MLLAACVTVSKTPDLEAIYKGTSSAPTPPLIIIPGLMGSALQEADGKEIWPVSVNNLAFTRYEALIPHENDGIQPGRLFDGIAGIDFYGNLLRMLERAGNYQQAFPGQAIGDKHQRRFYVLTYDWRKSNFIAVNRLHKLIEKIRQDYADPNLKVDIIAHSNGGLIARYYLQYGPLVDGPKVAPKPWTEGDKRLRRLVMLGTPNLGSIISVKRLYQGYDMGVRLVPPEIMAHFATPFETLPIPGAEPIFDESGKSVALDLYDAGMWERNHWSVFAPDLARRVNAETLAQAQESFRRNLARARIFQSALAKPLTETSTQIALFAGDCHQTEARALLENVSGSYRLAFVDPKSDKYPLTAPGDGLVTRESAAAREFGQSAQSSAALAPFPVVQTTFFCERHSLLTGNPFFQNNLLYFIFR